MGMATPISTAPTRWHKRKWVRLEVVRQTIAECSEHDKNMSEVFSSVRKTRLHKAQKENRSLILRKLCVCKSEIKIRLTDSPTTNLCIFIAPFPALGPGV